MLPSVRWSDIARVRLSAMEIPFDKTKEQILDASISLREDVLIYPEERPDSKKVNAVQQRVVR